MILVPVDGVSIFFKDILLAHPYGDKKKFPGCKSQEFVKLRESISQIFKNFEPIAPDIDVDASTIFTMIDLFKDGDEDSEELTLKNEPEKVYHEKMWYGYKIGGYSERYLQNYFKLNCTLTFVLKTDEYAAGLIGTIKEKIKAEEAHNITAEEEHKISMYYGFVKNCDLKEENSPPKNFNSYMREPAVVSEPKNISETECNKLYKKVRRICYASEIDTILSDKSTEEIVRIAGLLNNSAGDKAAVFGGIKGFDELFLEEIKDYIEKNKELKEIKLEHWLKAVVDNSLGL